MSEKILVIGSNGQIGTELVLNLRNRYGAGAIIASDIHLSDHPLIKGGPFELINVLDKTALEAVFEKQQPTQVYLLAAILSATGRAYISPYTAKRLTVQIPVRASRTRYLRLRYYRLTARY